MFSSRPIRCSPKIINEIPVSPLRAFDYKVIFPLITHRRVLFRSFSQYFFPVPRVSLHHNAFLSSSRFSVSYGLFLVSPLSFSSVQPCFNKIDTLVSMKFANPFFLGISIAVFKILHRVHPFRFSLSFVNHISFRFQ